jgi:hypothetical protein
MRDDYIAIIETVYCYATGIDTRDWSLYRSIFVDEVEMDFSSWDGIPAHRIAADDLRANIAVYFAGLDATQHSMTNPRVDIQGDRATCTMYMQAVHFLGGIPAAAEFTIGGYYTNQLVKTAAGWKLAGVKLTVLWERGNKQIMADAFRLGRQRLQQRASAN